MPHHEYLSANKVEIFHHLYCNRRELVVAESGYKRDYFLRFLLILLILMLLRSVGDRHRICLLACG